ncbi:MAG: hypothetical protein R3A47_03360 [Polyangiales bacterium]
MSDPDRREYEGISVCARKGARFYCYGDGFCCSDIHSLGPLDEPEQAVIALISPDAMQKSADGEFSLAMSESGSCVFLTDSGCAIHAALGAAAKPSACRRFPMGLIKTPTHARLTTEHRCPCRTYGDRPLVDIASLIAAVQSEEGELLFDHQVGSVIAIDADRTLPFEEYEAIESELIEQLLKGSGFRSILQAEPFPNRSGQSWVGISHALVNVYADGTRLDAALKWMGAAIAFLVEREPRQSIPRPWANAFRRTSEREDDSLSPGHAFGDWIADKLWAMHWTRLGSLRRARVQWSTELAIARRIAAWLMEDGMAEKLAIAEAICIVDVGSLSSAWDEICEKMF